MFCPKCGKDCGEFKFCPHCGTEVPKAESAPEQPVWSVGMACPHCGGTELKGNNCAFCGALLKEDVAVLQSEDQEWDSYEIPYRKFAVSMGSTIELKKQEMIATSRGLFFSNKKHIPYAQIIEAEYRRTEDYKGEMKFRWTSAQTASGTDETSLVCDSEDNCLFYYQVFCVIKLLLPVSARFVINCPFVDREKMERFSEKLNLRELFLRHAPCRESAAVELGAKCMILPEEARAFVHTLFDLWLKESYEAEPRFAARDYNRMMRFRKQRYEQWKQDRYGEGGT